MNVRPAPARRALPRMAGTLVLALVAGVAAIGLSAPASASVTQTAPAAPPHAAASSGKGHGPLSPRLAVVAASPQRSTEEQGERLDLPASGAGSLGHDAQGRLYVDVWGDTTAAVHRAASVPGAALVATGVDGRTATVAVPPTQLTTLGAIVGLRSAHEVLRPRLARSSAPIRAAGRAALSQADPRVDATAAPQPELATCPTGVRTEGDHQMGTDAVRGTVPPVTGGGVKIGIISDSYNAEVAASDVAAGELPGTGNPCGDTIPVQVIADQSGTDEGRAMAQIVHDVAPDATLLFADGGNSSLEMANHVRALRDAGANVIVDDIGWGDDPMYQDGPIGAAIDEVAAEGVAYFSSAGNAELKVGGHSVGSYETPAFRSTTCAAAVADNDSTCHDFDSGSGTSAGDTIGVPAHGSFDVSLGWNEPVFGVQTDLDLFLLDDTGKVLAYSAADNIRWGEPVEYLSYENTTGSTKKVRLVVARYGLDATTTPRFKLVLYTYSLASVQWNTSTGGDVVGPTLFGHANASGAYAIAAMDRTKIESFSSRGPALTCWEPEHGTSPAAAISPCTSSTIDLTGPDGVKTSMRNFNPFYGTSAAAPHVAALAALVLSGRPCASLDELRQRLVSTAKPIAATPTDAQGAGLARGEAVNAMVGPLCQLDPLAPPPATIKSVSTTGATVTLHPPTNGPVTTPSYHAQVVAPGGDVLQTIDNGTSSQLVLTLAPGQAYRVRTQVTTEYGPSPWGPSSAVIVPPFPSLSAFLSRLSQDFAGRTLTDWERQYLTYEVTDGYGPAESVLDESLVDEWAPNIDPVIRLYYAYFLRKPDPSGLTHWLNRRRAGVTLDVVSSNFAGSSEFNRTYGALSNKQFVQLVYQNVLGRAGDASGISYWTKQLDTKKRNRGRVMTGFSESSENIRKRTGDVLTIDLFFGMLGRVPTNDEIAHWSPLVLDHPGVRSLADFLITSPEYVARVS